MWYTGQTTRHSVIGLAESRDGITWQDVSPDPVFAASAAWEGGTVMAPDVILDDDNKFKMWYSAGGQFEPIAIGYAESQNGIEWTRRNGPVFSAAPGGFDSARVAGASIVKQNGEYLLFYIGFRNIEESAICIAKSKNGIDGWTRHPANPIITPGRNPSDWDYDAVYKPTVLQEENRWLLWYNGRRHSVEQIGLAVHTGLALGL
jgi:beta-xylosidase